jgi:hypothetical protein
MHSRVDFGTAIFRKASRREIKDAHMHALHIREDL